MKSLLTYNSFFSGIGGFEYSIVKANVNWKYKAHSEISQKAKLVYNKNFTEHTNNIENLDIASIDEIPGADIFVGGPPCQSFSIAGKKEGFKDNRGKLFLKTIDIVKQKQPKAFIFENVRGLKTNNRGNTLHQLLSEMILAGYTVYYKVLNSMYFDIPHHRNRIFFVGFRDDIHKNDIFQFPEGTLNPKLDFHNILNLKTKEDVYLSTKDLKRVYGFGTTKRFGGNYSEKPIYSCLTKHYGKANGHSQVFLRNGKFSVLSPEECEILQGFPLTFTEHPELSNKHRYECLGNTITTTVVSAVVQNVNNALMKML